jgi:hypothetical protein
LTRAQPAILATAVLAVLAGCLSGCDDDEAMSAGAAVEVLVAARGVDRDLATCVVDRLVARGVDLDVIGDGRVDPEANPEVVEEVAVCAAFLAGESARG